MYSIFFRKDEGSKPPLHRTVEVIEISSEESERYVSCSILILTCARPTGECSEELKLRPILHKYDVTYNMAGS